MLQREWVGKGIETLNKLFQHVEAQARGERHACIEIMSLQPLEWIDNSKGISSPDCIALVLITVIGWEVSGHQCEGE